VKSTLIYCNAFLVGGVLMGFEMLGSRYLFPYFGGGINSWAGLISTVLVALTIGYLIGGATVDRYPSPRIVATSIAVSSIYLALIPATADRVMSWILGTFGEGPTGILAASALLLLIPLSLLGTLSPVAVRLLTRSTAESGRVAGLVYGISTIGNVFGTLFTTFVLIPAIGSRSITYLFSGILALCSGSLFAVSYTSEADRMHAGTMVVGSNPIPANFYSIPFPNSRGQSQPHRQSRRA
jgi:MFS family permease